MCEGTHPFIPVPGVFKLQLIYTLHGQRMENVFHVKSGAGTSVGDANRIYAVVTNWWNTSARLIHSNQLSLVLIILDSLDNESALHQEYTTGWTAAGSVAQAVKSSGTALAVKLASGVRGRSYRGRIYWPGILDTGINTGLSQVTTTFRDSVVTSVNLLRTNLAGDAAGDKMVVVSYCADNVWRETGVWTEITSASSHLQLDSMRRRLPGRGL